MKRLICFLLSLTVLGLAACSQGGSDTMADAVQQQEERVDAAPVYAFENEIRSDRYIREDNGEEGAYYSYSIPMMRVVNENSLIDKTLATARHNVEVFNQRMTEILDEHVAYGKELLEEQKMLVEEENAPFTACDEVVARVVQSGEIITLVQECYYYSGGAHPYYFSTTLTFNLSVGEFIDPTQIADEPEQFRTTASNLLVRTAESLGEDYTSGYFPGYEETIARWNETSVIFDEKGMTVVFSIYELGPYAMGPVELTIPYDELADALGEGGLSLLGAK